MSKSFGFIAGIPYDFVFKKHPNKGWYRFYLGRYELGAIYPKTFSRNSPSNRTWGVIVNGDMVDSVIPRSIEGFKTRDYAIEYILQVHELTRHQYNTTLRDRAIVSADKGIDLSMDKSEATVVLRALEGQPLNPAEKREILHLTNQLKIALE